jgi:hypothetical protein
MEPTREKCLRGGARSGHCLEMVQHMQTDLQSVKVARVDEQEDLDLHKHVQKIVAAR